MGDSDDEYDRKRRDKFRGERSAGSENYRSERRDDRRREDWPERNPFRGRSRPDYTSGRGSGRYSPPPKRIRPDWGDDVRPRYVHEAYGMYTWGPDHYPMHGMHSYGIHSQSPHLRISAVAATSEIQSNDLQTQPPMLSLKQYLDTQDDSISDSEVLKKYGEYKLDFKRQQLNEFFVAHKDEEWFKNKYHPEESSKRKEEQLHFLNRRVEVFTELLEQGIVSNVTVDANQIDPLLRLLDTVVIKLEGGTEEDLRALDEKPLEPKIEISKQKDEDDVIEVKIEKENEIENDRTENIWNEPAKNISTISISKPPKTTGDSDWDESDNEKKIDDKNELVDQPKKRKRSNSESSSSSNSSASSSSSSSDGASKKTKEKTKEMDFEKYEVDKNIEEKNITPITALKKGIENQDEIENFKNTSKELQEGEIEKLEDFLQNSEEKPEATDHNIIEKQSNNNNVSEVENDIERNKKPVDSNPKAPLTLRHLHRTSSIFLRNLAPSITKMEIETICKRYDGFLRVAIADPLVERRWFRRGWVTFKRDVNIKEICWNLNNIRLRDCEMGAIVNRDLSRRVRPVNGITAHKAIVRSDIKLCAKIILNFDEKFNLWLNKLDGIDCSNSNENDDSDLEKDSNFGFKSNNPVLQNITDYLIEEASAEEDELLGLSSGGQSENKENSEEEQLERDQLLLSVLDKLILYLRIVHSVDFYNHCEYPYEDEMPNRCGIIHARGPPPQSKVGQSDIQDYIKNFEGKMASFFSKSVSVEEDEMKNLGAKDPEAEVEKFIQVNTQELAKDKWLCPLSGKKFKGPEFIRKHIFNKHGEKVEEVRKEVEYFNNYLKDARRPQLPEHPGNNKRQIVGEMPHAGPNYSIPTYAPPYAAYAPPMVAPPRRGFGGRRELPGGHERRVIGYHDLDAPPNFDMFD